MEILSYWVDETWRQEVGRRVEQESDPVVALIVLARGHAVYCRRDVARVAMALRLEHDALDALGESQAVEHLRCALVAHGALVPRDAPLFRFGCWLEMQTAKVVCGEDRRPLKTWAHWHLLNDLNYRRRRGKLTGRSVFYAWLQVSQSIAFVEWMRGQHLKLADCEQGHVDG